MVTVQSAVNLYNNITNIVNDNNAKPRYSVKLPYNKDYFIKQYPLSENKHLASNLTIEYTGNLFGKMISEFSKLSQQSYKKNPEKVGNWEQMQVVENKSNGFKGSVYKDKNKVAIVYTGSNDVKDFLINDAAMMNGDIPVQYEDALNLYNSVKKENPDKKIYVMGHSLGGSLTQLIASGDKSVIGFAFNPFGTKDILEKNSQLNLKDNNNVTNYVINCDCVSGASHQIGETKQVHDNYLTQKVIPNDNPISKIASMFKRHAIAQFAQMSNFDWSCVFKSKN